MTRSFSTCQSPNLCCARGASCHRKLSSQVVVAIRVVSTGQSKMLIDARAPSSWASQLGHSSASWVDSPVVSNTDTSCWVSSPAPRYSALDPFTSLEDRRHDQTVTRTRRRRRGSPPHMVLMGDVAVSSTSMQIGGNIGDSSIGSDIAAQWQPLWHEFAPRRHQTEDLLTRAVGYDVGAMDSFFAVRPERAWVRCAQVCMNCGTCSFRTTCLLLRREFVCISVHAGGLWFHVGQRGCIGSQMLSGCTATTGWSTIQVAKAHSTTSSWKSFGYQTHGGVHIRDVDWAFSGGGRS